MTETANGIEHNIPKGTAAGDDAAKNQIDSPEKNESVLGLLQDPALGLFVCLGYVGDDSPVNHQQCLPKTDDPRERFFVEAIRRSHGGKIKASDLYRQFLQWRELNNIDPGMTLTAFGKWVVKQSDMKKAKIGGYIYYLGVGLKIY